MSNEKVLLTIGEVAKLLDVSARHVRRMSNNNQFPKPVRLGGCVRWHRAVVEGFLKSLSLAVQSEER